MSALREIDQLLRERHLLKHPFYRAWSRGELTLPTLRDYAGQYYHFESAFPRYVAAAYSKLEAPADRRVLLENLVDEEGRDPTHPELWLDFAEALGLSRRAAARQTPRRAVQCLLETYEQQTSMGAGAALGALYAYEALFPEIAQEKSRGLAQFYGITEEKAHRFFSVHVEADRAHSAAERALLRRELRRSPDSASAVQSAAHQSLDAWWGFLDDFLPKAG